MCGLGEVKGGVLPQQDLKVNTDQDKTELSGKLQTSEIKTQQPGKLKVGLTKIFNRIKSLFTRSAKKDKIPGPGPALTRAQCSKLTQLLHKGISDSQKAPYAKMLARLLPKMQALAKNNENDFASYQGLISEASDKGLLDQAMTADVVNTELLTPPETLGVLKAFSEGAAKPSPENVKQQSEKHTDQARLMEKINNKLLNEIRTLPKLDSDVNDYDNVSASEKKTRLGQLFKKYSDTVISDLETNLKEYKPKTRQEKALQKQLLNKYEGRGADGITERDLAKMGRLLGRQFNKQINQALLAKYAMKGGDIKTTEYVDNKLKQHAKETLNAIKQGDTPVLNGKIETKEDLLNITKLLKVDGKNTPPEEIKYLRNKLIKKMDDLLPVSGGSQADNKLNQSLKQALKGGLFIATESLKYQMLSLKKKIGQGGGNAVLMDAGSKQEMMAKLQGMMEKEGISKAQRQKYQGWMDQLNDITREVNQSHHFVFKCYKQSDMEPKGVYSEFDKEYNISRQLHHPNIVNTYFAIKDTESVNARVGYVMDYCSKGDFSKVLEKDRDPGQTAPEDRMYNPETSKGVKNIAGMMLAFFNGVHHMHEMGFVHRDIKLENAFITKDNVLKVGDFGLTKETGKSITELNQQGSSNVPQGGDSDTQNVGTAQYIPPEIVGENSYKSSPKQDMYSLGMTALMAMFGGDEKKLVPTGVLHNFELAMAQPDQAQERITGWLDDPVFNKSSEAEKLKPLIEKLLSFNPDDRPGYEQAIQALKDIID